jgi:hypothetical protein
MHSRRRLPMNLSQIPFAWGVRYGCAGYLPHPALATYVREAGAALWD